MARKNAIKLDLDIAYASLLRGSAKDIAVGEDSDYVTMIDFVLSDSTNDFFCGQYEVTYRDQKIEFLVSQIETAKDDPIMKIAKGWDFGVNRSGLSNLPFSVFTDNRGEYPSILIRVLFPYRLASWIDPDHPTGIKMTADVEDIELGGSPRSDEKLEALKALNRLIKTSDISATKKPIQYDDVTVFIESYTKKGSKNVALWKLTALASKTAFRDAVEDYYLKGFDYAKLKNAVASLASVSEFKSGQIDNETILLDAVKKAVDDVLVHHIEDRNWVDAFWDGARTIKHNDQKIKVPRKPKNEKRIQPTLHVILDMALSPLGVQVIRESDEGVGLLDFRFLHTSKKGLPLSVGAEFKLAHHKQIKHGIRRQLPAYLRAIKSKSGLFAVMWFKDAKGKLFREPKQYDKEGFKKWVEAETQQVASDSGLNLVATVIDASIKDTASNR